MTTRQTPETKRPPGWKVEGAPAKGGDGEQPKGLMSRPPNRRVMILALILFAANWYLMSVVFSEPRVDFTYTQFLDAVESGRVETVFAQGDTIQGRFIE